jgi:hypothetical protein
MDGSPTPRAAAQEAATGRHHLWHAEPAACPDWASRARPPRWRTRHGGQGVLRLHSWAWRWDQSSEITEVPGQRPRGRPRLPNGQPSVPGRAAYFPVNVTHRIDAVLVPQELRARAGPLNRHETGPYCHTGIGSSSPVKHLDKERCPGRPTDAGQARFLGEVIRAVQPSHVTATHQGLAPVPSAPTTLSKGSFTPDNPPVCGTPFSIDGQKSGCQSTMIVTIKT